jgi:hypothetical protein
MPIKATTAEERRKLTQRLSQARRYKEERERYANARIAEEEEVATYFNICPLFAQGLLEMDEPNFIWLMRRTRQYMLDRQIDLQRSETVTENHLKRKAS